MELVDIVYWATFFLGLGFAVISALMSGVFSGGAEAHVGAGHDVHATAGDSVHFPLLSPVTLAMFVASFGGSGLIYKHALQLDPVAHVALAAVTAIVVALAVAWLFYKIFGMTQGSSEAKVSELVGTEAEIITAIPADGMGEIAYVAMQTRYNGPARTPDGKPLPARTTVKIVRMVSGTFIVEKIR